MQYKNLFSLDGQVALITGSTKGIGKAIAEAMAAHGARVVISSRKADACEAVAAEINAQGGEALPVPCNISHKDQLQSLVDTVLRKWGQIDTLVCNAAVNPYYGPMASVPDEAYDKTMGVNIRSNMWLCNMVLPQMAERNGERPGGSVIIISSIAGLKGSSEIGIYGLSKAADMQLARNLAVEWGPKDIRANCLAPAIIRTDFARALWENPQIYADAVRQYPLGRIGEVGEVAGAAVMLASAAGKFITGQTIVIDGGSTIATGL